MTLRPIEKMSLTTPAGDAVRDKYRREGAVVERERIIKLLEDTAIKNGKGTKAIHWHLDKLIALIKGENK